MDPTVKRKKKKKAVSASAVMRPHPKSRFHAEPPPNQWTFGHVVGALIIGVGLGGGVVYLAKDGGTTDAAKDARTASAAAPGAAAGQRPPQPPSAPVYMPLAEHSPRKGVHPAKVTILEYVDFQ